jgi:hypothetical protein
VLTVEFTVLGIPCLGLNGGPAFKHSEAFSFQIATENQEETDRYWNAIVGNGGKESQCGWCKDRWGLSWKPSRRNPSSYDFLSIHIIRFSEDRKHRKPGARQPGVLHYSVLRNSTRSVFCALVSPSDNTML